MKRYFPGFCLLLIALFGLENCRHEPPPSKKAPPVTDSSYIVAPVSIGSISPSGVFDLGPNVSKYVDSLTKEGIQLGRYLFYDKHLSLDGHKSCASCHRLQCAMSDSGYALSVNEFGHTKRNAMPLQNLAYAPYMFWDGRQPTIAAAVQDASQHELGLPVTNAIAYLKSDSMYIKLFKKAFGYPLTINENNIYLAIQEFLLTGITCSSHFDSVMRNQTQFTPDENDCFNNLFLTEKGDCFHCHAFSAYQQMTTYAFNNNGLDSAATIYDFKDPGRGGITGDPNDYGTFKTPSFRNIALSGPYMHDGRFKTLQQVIAHYSDSLELSPSLNVFLLRHIDTTASGQRLQVGGLHLSQQQQQEFLEFLNGFTDTSFLNNPNLRDPFNQ